MILSGRCHLARRISWFSQSVRNAHTLSGICSTEIVIKKSRFITIAGSITSRSDASEFLALHCQPKATHNCFAYKLGELEKVDDDGEVSGTAGVPILNAIKSQDFDGIIVLVIR